MEAPSSDHSKPAYFRAAVLSRDIGRKVWKALRLFFLVPKFAGGVGLVWAFRLSAQG